MPAHPIELLDLPHDILHLILFHAIQVRFLDAIPTSPTLTTPELGRARALRLRVVCKTFNAFFLPAFFKARVLDQSPPYTWLAPYTSSILEAWPLRRNHSARDLWHSYFVYRVQNEMDPTVGRYVEVRHIAEVITHESGTTSDIIQIIRSLCWLGLGMAFGTHCLPIQELKEKMTSSSPDASLISAAAFLGHKSLVQRLLSNGNDPTHHDYLFPAAIEAAAFAGDKEMLQLLQESLPDGVSPSPPMSPSTQHYALGQVRFKGKADPQAIFGATIKGDMDILQIALRPPSRNINSNDNDIVKDLGYAPMNDEWNSEAHKRNVSDQFMRILNYADNWAVYSKLAVFAPEHAISLFKVAKYADYGHLEMVQALLDAGASLEEEMTRRDSPLCNAARRGFNDIVQLLLARGADVNKRNSPLGTPLRGAVLGSSLSTVQILLNYGAVCDEDVLVDAMLGEHMALAELILDHCTKENLHDENFGFRAARMAAESGLTSMVELMENRECFIYRDGEMVPWAK